MKRFFLMILGIACLQLTSFGNAFGYSTMLPDTPPTDHPLPYVAEQDHYTGPAVLQMALNSCPAPAARHYNAQDALYAAILAHNAEPLSWFSSPTGLRDTLGDASLSPCGHWADYSGTDKSVVLGKLLYYMDTMKYLMPVSIGSSEHWVSVIGFQTDAKPPFSGTVTLQNIFFYDPLPGATAAMWVTGAAWMGSPDYWGVPLSKPGSAWNGKYLAIVEPPKATVMVTAKEWLVQGTILPVERIERSVADWIRGAKREGLLRKPFDALKENSKVEKPVLVVSEKYSYYLVPFADRHLMAVFNAYDGSFEELKYATEPQRRIVPPQKISEIAQEAVKIRHGTVVEMTPPQLRYAPGSGGRFSPAWETTVKAKEASGNVLEIPFRLDTEGHVMRGLELSGGNR